MKKKVFIPTYGGGHVNIAMPIAKELEKQGIEVVVLGLTIAIPSLERENIKYKKIQDYLFLYSEKQKKIIEEIGEKLALPNHNNQLNISFEDTKYYYGIGMYCLIEEYGEAIAYKMYSKSNRKAFCPISFIEKILKYERPKAVTSSCTHRYEKASLIAAKKNNISTYYFCDYLEAYEKDEDYFDYVFCLNEWNKNHLIKMGFDRKKLKIIGQPAFDSLFNLEVNINDIKNKFKIDFNKKIITWICTETDDMNDIYEEIEKTSQELANSLFIIKMHPRSKLNYFDDSKMNNNIIIVRDYPIQPLLKISDVIIGTISTSIHEAMILNKPIIIPDYIGNDYENELGYCKSGAVMLIKERNVLTRSISQLLNDESIRLKYEKNRSKYMIPKNAANAAANIIIKNME